MSSRVYDCLSEIAEKIIANKDFLTDLDREIGDADHGTNMARGFAAVLKKISPDENDIGVILKKTGTVLLSTVGGASGPLYGTAFMDAGKVMTGKTEITSDDMKLILEAFVAGVQRRGHAVKGEKTMLDALIPASEKFSEKISNGENMISALEAACESAREGVEYSKSIMATKGRASYLLGRSIGHQDPGATSTALMLEAVLEHIKKNYGGA